MKEKTRLQKILLITVLLMTVLIMPVVKSEAAAAKPKCEKNHICYLVNGFDDFTYQVESCTDLIYIKNLTSDAVIYGIKSSNKNLTAERRMKMSALLVSPIEQAFEELKPGVKTTISFKVKQRGKVYNLKCNVKFAKSPVRFQSVKIGSRNLTAAANKSDFVSILGLGGTQKFDIKTTAGFALDYIEVAYTNNTSKRIKSGQSISLNNASSVIIYYKHTKKPKYYSSKGFGGWVPSPLHGAVTLVLG